MTLFNKPMFDILDFRTNLPELVTFKFNDFREGTNQYGAWYKYVVQHKGVDKVIFAKEGLHRKLQSCTPLEGKELEITLAEVDGRKQWKLYSRGEEVTGGQAGTNSYQKPQEGAKMEATSDTTEKMRTWAKKTNERLNSIEVRLRAIEEKLFPETGELSADGVHATAEDLEKIVC